MARDYVVTRRCQILAEGSYQTDNPIEDNSLKVPVIWV